MYAIRSYYGHRVARIVAHRLAFGIDQDDFRLQLVALRRGPPVDHDLLGHTGGFVGLFPNGDARDQVDELRGPRFLGDDRQGVGVPFEQLVATADLVAVLDESYNFV